MSRHRSASPRYGRIVLAAAALGVTTVSVLGGVGLVPTPSSAAGERLSVTPPSAVAPPVRSAPEPVVAGPSMPADAVESLAATLLPQGSGEGRRVVFSEEHQRVWLVRGNGSVRRTHLVSGSIEDNLDPGTYQVYSRSRWAVGIDDSGVMEFFVRFTRGEHAAIGFHTIPTKLGQPLQTRAELGTPLSHGCIRQARADAVALWKFAPEGTAVVVV
ncbi:L,D-transpeptidase [Nocardioides piscis]|uniref:L,D-transpeptidase family protein n=1 Tax=Nocardioides piscis TaxID=2714938 RepID=A0A6G7YFT6_9ACTN|nr:L,D-transpeptidase [Nocardioides piscis]QIK75640.1 L,D-transpeptidase family protein [Nocardioides piscis]